MSCQVKVNVKVVCAWWVCVWQEAVRCGVCMVWDAEQTYLHPAIDLLVLQQMRRFNVDRPVIYNTYQCYLKV